MRIPGTFKVGSDLSADSHSLFQLFDFLTDAKSPGSHVNTWTKCKRIKLKLQIVCLNQIFLFF